MYTLPKIERFNQNVLSINTTYTIVFSLLCSLSTIDNTEFCPLFTDVCECLKLETPKEIIESSLKKYLHSDVEADKIDLMFLFYTIY
jgi:phosphoenolpyruvate carboxylase